MIELKADGKDFEMALACQPQSVWLLQGAISNSSVVGDWDRVYVVLISISGSILVFRNELYESFTATPIVVEASGPRLSEDASADPGRAGLSRLRCFTVLRKQKESRSGGRDLAGAHGGKWAGAASVQSF